jgi:hypothetical protein
MFYPPIRKAIDTRMTRSSVEAYSYLGNTSEPRPPLAVVHESSCVLSLCVKHHAHNGGVRGK